MGWILRKEGVRVGCGVDPEEGVRVGCGVDPEGGRSEGGVWGGS